MSIFIDGCGLKGWSFMLISFLLWRRGERREWSYGLRGVNGSGKFRFCPYHILYHIFLSDTDRTEY
jgi:hypothetical protein